MVPCPKMRSQVNDRLPLLPISGDGTGESFIVATVSARNASRSGTSPTIAQLVAFPFGPDISSSRSTNGPVVRVPIHDLFPEDDVTRRVELAVGFGAHPQGGGLGIDMLEVE